MKREKILKIFTQRIPENEWEAKYLIDDFKLHQYIIYLAIVSIFFVVAIAAIGLQLIQTSSQCEFEFTNASSSFEFGEDFKGSVQNIDGKVKISGPCGWFSLPESEDLK